MAKTKFLLFSLILFLLKFLVFPILNWQISVDFFAVFILAFIVSDKQNETSLPLTVSVIVLFDIFSGGFLGAMSTALALTILVIFLIRKFLLISNKNYALAFLFIFLCYQFYRFVLFSFERLYNYSLFFDFYGLFVLSVAIIFFMYVTRQEKI